MCGILRAARQKLLSSSAPSMMSALVNPSLPRRVCSALVFASPRLAFSITTMSPSLAFAESACLSASARTFFGRSMAWLRTTGPNARPPPRKILTRAETCRAFPVPFWRYSFLPVRLISDRFFTLCVPAWRLASCHFTQRCRMAGRGSSPKIVSLSSTEPDGLPSRVVTFSSMSRPLAAGFGNRSGGRGFSPGDTERARLRDPPGPVLFHRVADRDPAALRARDCALDQDETALDIGLHDLEIERGDPLDPEMARHLLVLEGLAGILTSAGRAVRAMRNRHAVGGPQPGEIPALHR